MDIWLVRLRSNAKSQDSAVCGRVPVLNYPILGVRAIALIKYNSIPYSGTSSIESRLGQLEAFHRCLF